jgi:2,4-dienoyl-CoA reductase-like NADH-dependent reductase (Old Yellow Enzyme family)
MPSPLLTPFSFRNGRRAPNRIWLAPMTNQQSHDDGTLSGDELRWLEARAEGGFGVIESCATHVALDGQGWPGELGIFDDATVPGWRQLSEAMHAHGALLLAQVFHGGARAIPTEDGRAPWSCSASGEGNTAVRRGSDEDIEQTIDAFAESARRLVEAGADGVELHGAHGYLLCQFLSTTMNRRKGDWGGSLENRARLIRRVMQATRAAVPADFIVGARLSPEDFGATTGLDLDESIQVAHWLCEDGADFIHISLWDAAPNSKKYPEHHTARLFRDALPAEVPIITAGKIWTQDDALRQLDHGADAVALGRGAIANPDWPRRVVEQGLEPDRPPLSAEQLRERALGESFIEYMRRWPGFVA